MEKALPWSISYAISTNLNTRWDGAKVISQISNLVGSLLEQGFSLVDDIDSLVEVLVKDTQLWVDGSCYDSHQNWLIAPCPTKVDQFGLVGEDGPEKEFDIGLLNIEHCNHVTPYIIQLLTSKSRSDTSMTCFFNLSPFKGWSRMYRLWPWSLRK